MPFLGGLIAPALLEPARVASVSTSRSPATGVIVTSSGAGSSAPVITVAAGADTPSLSVRTFWNARAADPGFGTTATLLFAIDGLLKYTNGSSSLVNVAGEWWSAGSTTGPDIGDSYDVRCASISSGPAWFAQAAAVGTWITMSSTAKSWTVNRQTDVDGSGTTETVGVFEIRAVGAGPVLASASFTGQAILT